MNCTTNLGISKMKALTFWPFSYVAETLELGAQLPTKHHASFSAEINDTEV